MICSRGSPIVHPFHNILARSFVFSTNNLLFIPFFSTSSTSHLAPSPNSSAIQDFLQKLCGLSQQSAILASQSLLRLKSTQNAEQVVQFFQERGFTDAHILNMVTSRPKVLASSVHKTLQPKLRVFEDLGIVGNELGRLISKNPTLLRVSVERKFIPGISFLRKMLGSNDNVVKVLMRHPWILRVHIEKKIKPNYIFLQSIGVDDKFLLNLFMRKTRFFLSTEALVKDVVNTVDKFGVSRHSGIFPYAIFVVCSMNKTTLERKIEFLISLGLSKEEVLVAFRKSPFILAISEEKLQNHMDFLVKTLKCKPSVIVFNPHFFMTSMEAKIIPRYRVLQMLQSMQLPKENFSVLSMFSMSERRFLERFVLRYGESSEFTRCMRSQIPVPGTGCPWWWGISYVRINGHLFTEIDLGTSSWSTEAPPAHCNSKPTSPMHGSILLTAF
eukprot:Gb_35262 [translate_table: standard]